MIRYKHRWASNVHGAYSGPRTGAHALSGAIPGVLRVLSGRMIEILAGILFNVACHAGLARALAAHPALPQAIISAGLCGCHDSVALTATCKFLEQACACEVRGTRVVGLAVEAAGCVREGFELRSRQCRICGRRRVRSRPVQLTPVGDWRSCSSTGDSQTGQCAFGCARPVKKASRDVAGTWCAAGP